MKTPPIMIVFLPRFRWFVWGMAVFPMVDSFIDGPLLLIGASVLLFVGASTYPVEAMNRKLVERMGKEV